MPDQVPVVAVRVDPALTVPEMVGATELEATGYVTALVALDTARDEDPAAFVRMVATRILSSAYESGTTYVELVAPEMSVHVAPLSLDTCH